MSQVVRVVTRALVVALFVLVGCSKAAPTDHAGEAAIGKVIAVTGDVAVTTGASPDRQPVVVGLAVTRAMTFTTGPGATLEVRFDNNYTWKLEENQAKAVAKLSFIDLPAAPAGGQEGAGDEADRTASAGRHAERAAVETEATALRNAQAELAEKEAELRRLDAERAAVQQELEHAQQRKLSVREKTPRGHKDRKKKINLSQECLNNPLGCDSSPPPPAPDKQPDLPLEPSFDDVKAALVAITPDVQACYSEPIGVVTISLTIEGSGQVSRVVINGNGKAAEACVGKAVRTATFPRSRAGMTIRYRFKLN